MRVPSKLVKRLEFHGSLIPLTDVPPFKRRHSSDEVQKGQHTLIVLIIGSPWPAGRVAALPRLPWADLSDAMGCNLRLRAAGIIAQP